MTKSRIQENYETKIFPELKKMFPGKNVMILPRLMKIVLCMGIAKIAKEKTAVKEHTEELTQLSGQHPITINAKKSISNFNLREGTPVALKVTLRKKRMYDFFDRFCNIISPRILDFRGFNNKLDGRGNYTVGIKDQQVFPELNLDKVKRTQGLYVTFCCSSNDDNISFQMLKMMGLPFLIENDRRK